MAPGIDFDVQDRDVWDDKALIDTWERAYTEYKRYHSIQAQGKRLEDMVTAEELAELKKEHGDLVEDAKTVSEPALDATAEEEAPAMLEADDKAGEEQSTKAAETPGESHNAPQLAAIPQAMLGTVQDENLKNLMMSWYYSGYYTGLYEGQHKAAAAAAAAAESNQKKE
jgi:hypothetical protein